MNSRRLAADIIEECLERKGQSHRLLRDCFARHAELPRRERAFITALVHGTLGHALTLDFYLEQVSRLKPAALKPYVRSVLRMSLFQLKYMDRVPASAVCNEAVKLIRKRMGEGLVPFVNGVLREAARKENWQEPEEDKALSLPKELYNSWLSLYGQEKLKQIGESFLKPPLLWGRWMKSRCRREELASSLKQEGYEAFFHDCIPQAVRLERIKEETREILPPEKLSAFAKGWIQWQDISAQLAVEAAQPGPGMRVLDLCAAPGGKSLQAADMMQDQGEITACDISSEKCRRIEENRQRTGFRSLKVMVSNALLFRPDWEKAFDLVIADLPCSGLGTACRKPEVKYRATEKEIEELALLQREMLRQAVRYIKPGGKLLFSTCTLTQKENEENADWLAREAGLVPETINLALPEGILPSQEGRLSLLPGDMEGDGFFISLFRAPEVI